MGGSPAVCCGRRHGIIGVLDSSQTLELSQGASVSSMSVFCGRPSLAILPRHSMPGNVCKQWPPTKERGGCAEEARSLGLTSAGMDGDQTPASLGPALPICAQPRRGGRASGAWRGCVPLVFHRRSAIMHKSCHSSFMRKSVAIPGVLPRKEGTYKYTKTQQDLVFCKRKHDCDISPENEESFFFDAKLLSLRNNTRMQFCADRTWVLK